MRDSLTYQAILEEGRVEGEVRGEQRLLLRQGTVRLGPPDDHTRSRILSMTDINALERLGVRILTASTWEELLADA